MCYRPERVFIHNLFLCCGRHIDDFHFDICDNVSRDFRFEVKKVQGMCKEKMDSNGETRILPARLSKYVKESIEEIRHSTKQPKKSKDYCLFTLLSKVRNTRDYLAKLDNVSDWNRTCDSDLQVLDQLVKVYDYFESCNAEPISKKSLERIFEVKGKKYNDKNQKKFIFYLLEKIFPQVKTPTHRNFLSELKQQGWEKLVFSDLERPDKNCILTANTESFEEIRSHFEQLLQFSDNEYEQIGTQLIAIFMKLESLYNEGAIFDTPHTEMQNFTANQTKTTKLADNALESLEYDGAISSHILYFMSWLPMRDENDQNEELINSVSNVIDVIREDVLAQLGTDITFEDFYNRDYGLFVRMEHINLRRALILAMHNEVSIHSNFHLFYGFAI